jgi:hypothetical protein
MELLSKQLCLTGSRAVVRALVCGFAATALYGDLG